MDTNLFPAQDLSAVPPIPQPPEPPRLRKAERRQVALLPLCVDELIPPQHQARTLWALVEGLDLTGFQADLKARGSEPGRAATDPKILVALWLWAATQGVGSARELDRLCQEHGAYRWLCGGVAVNNSGSDQGADQPMRQQIAARQQSAQPMGTAQQTGTPVQEHLVDGGYAQHAAVENAAAEGVTLYAPVMQKKRKDGQNTDPYAPRPGDSPEVIAWRQRMASAAGREIYKLRAATSETCNADLKCHRGLLPFRVRGLAKVLAVTLWSALAYNLLHFGPVVLEALRNG